MSPLSVDVHAHALVPAAEALVADRPELAQARAEEARGAGPRSTEVNLAQIGQLGPALIDPQVRLAAMDAAGIDVQLVSPMPIHHYWAGPDLAARYVEAVNSGILAHCSAAPGRLIGLGTAPLQHPGLAAEVLRRAVGDGLRGVEVATYVAGLELADPSLEPFWSTAAELDAVVFVHPWGCTLGERLSTAYLSNIVGNPVEPRWRCPG
jgi:aminocarboxymuconate-semialdehyde decarboxylase